MNAMPGPIVVGIDGSECSIEAAAWALREAHARGTPLVALSAWSWMDQPGEHFDPTYGPTQVRAAAEEALAKARRLAPEADAVDVDLRIVNDLSARALLTAAAGARLLVVGSRGLGGFKGLLLGSVSEQCVRHASCPVVVVRPRHSPTS